VVIEEWRKIHNEELHDLYSPNIIQVIKKNEIAGHAARVGDRRGTYRILVGRPEGKTAIGRPRTRWGYNIKIYLTEMRCSMDWFYLAQDMETWRTAVNAVLNLWVL
jgi:hypothetical protein